WRTSRHTTTRMTVERGIDWLASIQASPPFSLGRCSHSIIDFKPRGGRSGLLLPDGLVAIHLGSTVADNGGGIRGGYSKNRQCTFRRLRRRLGIPTPGSVA